MSRRRRARRQQGRSSRKGGADRTPVSASLPAESHPDSATEQPEEEAWLAAAWRGSRAGARAGRGFHFQDVVGAWLASRLASGDLSADRLTPEGFDDLQLDGSDPVQIEVKSRQTRLGPFPLGDAATHIVDAWLRHSERFGKRVGDSRRLVLVFEQGLEGFEPTAERGLVETPLEHVLEAVEELRGALMTRIESRTGSSATVSALVADTALVVASWDDILGDTVRHIGAVVPLPPAGLQRVARDVRIRVAEAIDANAEVEYPDGSSLDRTGLVAGIHETAELVDLEAIEYALSRGICSPFTREPLDTGDAYYEGVSTQPGHVAAGLVVARPDLTARGVEALDKGRAVVFAGPSGVGKSAVLWALPFAVPGVLWFRVNRVSEGDTPHLERLLRAYGTSPRSPVGLLVDSAGRGRGDAWAELRESVARIPGAFLAGTARSEDLFSLGDLADCEVVTVSLDEEAAAAIHGGLLRRGATATPHWREAFEQSDGLTLEFTHLLTRGTRLREVIADQVADRLNPSRSLEFRVLTHVATADRWSASLPVHDLQAFLGADPVSLAAALRRLVEEHLLVEREGTLTGVHQLRSRALVDAIHEVPPPVLEDSILSVLGMLHGQELSRFAYEVLREEPQFEEVMLDVMEELVRDDVERLLACLRALELLDFYRQASAWAGVMERRNVAASQRPFVMWMATSESELPAFFPEEIRNALTDMLALPAQSSTRKSLLETAGLRGIATALADASSAESCQRLLMALRQASADWRPLLPALSPSTALTDFLENCPVDVLGECVAAAHDVSPEFAGEFVSAVGGREKLIERIRSFDPWIRELRIDTVDGDLVGVARYLFASESDQGDPRERSVELGRLLLRVFPDIVRVDVKPVLAGGGILESDGQELHSSGLVRKHDHTPSAVAWNRERVQLAQTLFGATETERLAKAGPLLADVAELLQDFGNAFVRNGAGGKASELSERNSRLMERARRLPPPTVAMPVIDGASTLNDGWSPPGDDLSALVADICGNVLPRATDPDAYVALSAYINETVLGRSIPAVKSQPWNLLGLDNPPEALDAIASSLSDLDAVVTELSVSPESARRLVGAGKSGPADRALARAADWARKQTDRRIAARRKGVAAELRSMGLAVDVFWSDGDRLKGESGNFAVTVEVASLADWEEALPDLAARVESLRVLGEMPLLVPLLRGHAVRVGLRKLGSKLFVVTDFGEFEQVLPCPLEERLSAQVLVAHSALDLCSALSVVGHEGELDERLATLLERSIRNVEAASEAIVELGDDAVIRALIEWLAELAQRIEDEWNGETQADQYAASFAEGVLGGGSREAELLGLALILSVQWDADPASALAMLESWTQ